MPIQFGKFIKSVEEIQDEKDNAEQFDAAADEAVTQIAEQNDGRLGARDMRSRRDDQRSHDQLFDMTEYLLGGLLDMLGVERKPPGFDILHDFSFGRHRTDWPIAWLKQRLSESLNTTAPRSRSKTADHPT